MNTMKFLEAMNDIDSKYIHQADIFQADPKREKRGRIISEAFHWAGALAALVLVVSGCILIWGIDWNERIPASSGVGSEAPEGVILPSPTVNGDVRILSPGDVSIDKDGYLTFTNPEFQELYRVSLSHEPVTGGESDPTNRVLTLTLPCYIADRYPVNDRTHILFFLLERNYQFLKSENGNAYLNMVEEDAQPAGAIGYYEKDGSVVSADSGGVFRAEQVRSFHYNDSFGTDLYWENLHAFINGTDQPEHSTGIIEEDALQANEKLSQIYDSWNIMEELADGLLYSYLEQNDMLEYLETRFVTGATETNETWTFEEEARRVAPLAAQSFVDKMLSDEEHPLTECFYRNLKVGAVAKDESFFCIDLQIVFKIRDEADTDYWMAGNTKEGTGEDEGYYAASRILKVERLSENWYLTTAGTGYGITDDMEEVNWAEETDFTACQVSIDKDGALSYEEPEFQEIYDFIADQPPVTDGSFFTDESRRCDRILSLTLPHTMIAREKDYVLVWMEKVLYGFFDVEGEKRVEKLSRYSGPVAVDIISSGDGSGFKANGFWQPDSDGFHQGSLNEAQLDSLAEFMGISRESLDTELKDAESSVAARSKDLVKNLLFSYMHQHGMSGYSLWDEETKGYVPITEEEMLRARIFTDKPDADRAIG